MQIGNSKDAKIISNVDRRNQSYDKGASKYHSNMVVPSANMRKVVQNMAVQNQERYRSERNNNITNEELCEVTSQ